MTDTETTMAALREWKRARSALLAGIAQHETWMKAKGKGAEAIDPTPPQGGLSEHAGPDLGLAESIVGGMTQHTDEHVRISLIDWAGTGSALMIVQTGEPHPHALVPYKEVLDWCSEQGITVERHEPFFRVSPEMAAEVQAKWLSDLIYP